MKRLWPSLALSAAAACASDNLQETPFVQASAAAKPRWSVDINRVTDGIYRSYRPRCIDTVRSGHAVEFRNFLPEVPANVTSIAGPGPLYSPNLVRPYNYVGPEDETNTLCEVVTQDGACTARPAWSYWRFVFEIPGVYDWVDTNQTSPGRKVVDPYYGTVTFVGIDPNAPFGTICVRQADGSGCDKICCTRDADCEGTNRCYRSVVDAEGRCLTPSG